MMMSTRRDNDHRHDYRHRWRGGGAIQLQRPMQRDDPALENAGSATGDEFFFASNPSSSHPAQARKSTEPLKSHT
jgi:hypothetical protein